MLCCVSRDLSIDDDISDLSNDPPRIIPGFERPESELDWEDITVFQWPNAREQEGGYYNPQSTLGSEIMGDVHKRHPLYRPPAPRGVQQQLTGVSHGQPPKGKFSKHKHKGEPYPQTGPYPDKLPGELPHRHSIPVPPPLPPGREELPHIPVQPLQNSSPDIQEPNGNVIKSSSPNLEPGKPKAVPIQGNLQFNIAVTVQKSQEPPSTQGPRIPPSERSKRNDDVQSLPPTGSKKVSGSTKKKFSLRKPAFFSESAFGGKKKARKSKKAYPAPLPPGYKGPPASSIDTGMTEGRLPAEPVTSEGKKLDNWQMADIQEEDSVENSDV